MLHFTFHWTDFILPNQSPLILVLFKPKTSYLPELYSVQKFQPSNFWKLFSCAFISLQTETLELWLLASFKHTLLSYAPRYISTSHTQGLDPGSVRLRHLQFLTRSGAGGRDRRALVAGERSHLPVELQQQIAGSRKVSVAASCLPGPGRGAPENRVHWVNKHSFFMAMSN